MKKSKKYRIKNKFRFITSLTIMMLLVAFASSCLFGFGVAAGSDVMETITVEVHDGDTLWDLAKTYGPKNMDCRRLVYEIQKINGVNASSLVAGQSIEIPVSAF